jgi:hypothetical protein
MSSTSDAVIVQGPWPLRDINSPQKAVADTLSRAHKREARLFAQKAEADRLNAVLAVTAAAEAFVRSINKMVAVLAVMQARPNLYGFRRIEGGKGASFLPHRFEADGSLVYRRARHTRALAQFTSKERQRARQDRQSLSQRCPRSRGRRGARVVRPRDERGGASRSSDAIMTALPEFQNDIRDLPPALLRTAVFIVAIGPGPGADRRCDSDTAVSGCDSASCLIPTREVFARG